MQEDRIGNIISLSYPRWLICLYDVGNLCGLRLSRAGHASLYSKDCLGVKSRDVEKFVLYRS